MGQCMCQWEDTEMVAPSLVSRGATSVISRSEVLRSHRGEVSGMTEGLVGLENLGNTCFMNSALQCLSHTPPLRDYFLSARWKRDLNPGNPLGHRGKMAKACVAVSLPPSLRYAELMQSLWLGSAGSVSPSPLKSCLSRYAPQFGGSNQEDSQEVTAYILDGLHEDLNRARQRKYEEENFPSGIPLEELALLGWRSHLQRNLSIVVDVFQGQLKTTLVCRTCCRRVVKFDPFMFLSLPIDNSHPECSVSDCLRLFTREQELSGSNQWYCPTCCTHRVATLKYDLYRLPPLLIIHLVRFRSSNHYQSRKLTQFVSYPVSDLDLSSFLQECPVEHYSTQFSLYAVSMHSGSLSGGHYTAYCRDPEVEPARWYYFNDSCVSPVSSESVVSSSAYLLFYTMMVPEGAGVEGRGSMASVSSSASGVREAVGGHSSAPVAAAAAAAAVAVPITSTSPVVVSSSPSPSSSPGAPSKGLLTPMGGVLTVSSLLSRENGTDSPRLSSEII